MHASEDLASVSATVVQSRIADLVRELLGTSAVETSFGKYGDRDRRRGFACFDIFGADILLDRSLQPWVMEFNIGPNLWTKDHGEGHEELLLGVKKPFMQQVARWMAL